MSKKPPPETITLTFDLLELPTAQHRAGLAGLILQIEAMNAYKHNPALIPIIDEEQLKLTPTSATITFTPNSMQGIFNELYAAKTFDQKFPAQKKKGKDKNVRVVPEDAIEIVLVRGKETKLYVYRDAGVRPSAPFFSRHIDPAATSWIDLWRRMVWEVLRNEQARAPFKQVAHAGSCTLGSSMWELLAKNIQARSPHQGKSQKITGALMVGAQAVNAEAVPFAGRVDHNLLLHFWQLVVLTFVPFVIDKKERKAKSQGYVLAIPDVADLVEFRHALPAILQSLEAKDPKHTPDGARLDLPDQACLEVLRILREEARNAEADARAEPRDDALPTAEEMGERAKSFEAHLTRRDRKGEPLNRNEGHQALVMEKAAEKWGQCIRAVESFHMFKPKNSKSAKMLSFARVADRPGLVENYERIKKSFRNPLFRAVRMQAILQGRPWHWGMTELFAWYPWTFFIEGDETPKYLPRFGRDAKEQFQAFNEDLKGMRADEMNDDERLKQLGLIIQRLVTKYVEGRAESKTGKKVKEFPKTTIDGKERRIFPTEFREAQQRVCSDAFLSIRSRHDQDFVEFFAGSVCSVAQYLSPDEYQFLIKTLMTKPDPNPIAHNALSWEDVKAVAMIAISACSFNVRPRDAQAQGSPS